MKVGPTLYARHFDTPRPSALRVVVGDQLHADTFGPVKAALGH